jgi:hypothetical protein
MGNTVILRPFWNWAISKRRMVTPLANLNLAMVKYFEHCAKELKGPLIGRNMMYGYLRLDAVNEAELQFDGAKKSLLESSKLIPGQVRDSVPEKLVYLICEEFIKMGMLESCIATLLMYGTYARPFDILGQQHDCGMVGTVKGRDWTRSIFAPYVAFRSSPLSSTPIYCVGKSDFLFPNIDLSGLESNFKLVMERLGSKMLVSPHVMRHEIAPSLVARYEKHAKVLWSSAFLKASWQRAAADSESRLKKLLAKRLDDC